MSFRGIVPHFISSDVSGVGGSVFTLVTNGAGDAFTLATGAGGVVTSIGGSLYTIASGGVASATR